MQRNWRPEATGTSCWHPHLHLDLAMLAKAGACCWCHRASDSSMPPGVGVSSDNHMLAPTGTGAHMYQHLQVPAPLGVGAKKCWPQEICRHYHMHVKVMNHDDSNTHVQILSSAGTCPATYRTQKTKVSPSPGYCRNLGHPKLPPGC